MATTFVDYTGDGNATKSFSFPSIKEADVKVDVDGVIKTSGSHYNITSYTTTGGGNVVFTSGNIPASPASIRIFRDTDVDTSKATFTAGSSVKAGDLNLNQKQLLYAAQEEQNQTILTSDIKDAAVTTAKIKADNITSALIADDQINSEHYVDGSIDTAHIADDAITMAKIADGAVNDDRILASAVSTVKLRDANVTTAKIADANVTTAKIANSAVTTAKIADVNVTTDKIAGSAVTSAKIADLTIGAGKLSSNAVTTAKILDGNVTRAKLEADIIDGTKIANNAVDSEHITAGSIDNGHLASASVASGNIINATIAGHKIANDTITAGNLASNSVTTVKITDSNVTTAKIADDAVTQAKIAANAVDTTELAVGAVTHDQLADNTVDADHLQSNAVTTAKIAGANVTDAKLASNSVITSKITDANVTTVKIADSNVTLAKLASDLKQTTISDSDTQLPTSGAVVDYVAAQLLPFGGFEAIATEVAFPNTQPASGVIISISDAQGVVVNGSGTSTTGRTVGGSTVTINNFPSSLNSETLAAGVGLMVSSTGSSQTYNYHKILAAEADVKTLSGDINDFAERYRVGSSNPTSNLDGGDLFFNTGSGKLLVYNATSSAWEETQSVGNFFINTISSYSGTGGNSATFNGSAYRFVLSNPGANAEQHLVSINGVIQKPNTGTSQPSEGFAIDGSSIIFSAAPASGADFFIITIGASVSIGTPSDGTVSTAKLASGAVTTAKIADDAITTAKLADNSVTTAQIANGHVTTAKITDDAVTAAKLADNAVDTNAIQSSGVVEGKIANGAVTEAKIGTNAVTNSKIAQNAVTAYSIADATISDTQLATNCVINSKIGPQAVTLSRIENGTSSNDGKFLRANNGASPTFETVNTDLVSDTSPQLGNALDCQTHNISLSDSSGTASGRIRWGNSQDLQIYHTGSVSRIQDLGTGGLEITSDGTGVDINKGTSEYMARFITDGAVELYHNNIKQLSTRSDGIEVHAPEGGEAMLYLTADEGDDTNDKYRLVAQNGGDLVFQRHNGSAYSSELRLKSAGGMQLNYQGSNRFETTTAGVNLPSANAELAFMGSGTCDHSIQSPSGTNDVVITANKDAENVTSNIVFKSSGSGGGTVSEKCRIDGSGHFRPGANNTFDLGTSSLRWRNVYTNDLHLSNEGHTNSVDGTWGDWTIQEGESDLFLKNNRSGKKYKFNLTEVS